MPNQFTGVREGWEEGGVGYIPLTQGQVAKVDAEDLEWLTQWCWQASLSPVDKRSYYARRLNNLWMSRFILGVTDPAVVVDHVNHDTLDNRRANLRTVTYLGNSQNRCVPSTNKTGCKGVCFDKRLGRYRAYIYDGKAIHLGLYDTAEEAAKVREAKALELFGEFAYQEGLHGQ